MKRIGIMGGTFNPIHYGHLLMAERAYEQMNLDIVWFMPNHVPAYKKLDETVGPEDRIAMVQAAIGQNPHFAVNTMEVRRGGSTYTADTLEILKRQMPDAEFFFIMGTDSLFQFGQWKEPEKIARYATLLIAARDTKVTPEQIMEQSYRLYHQYGATILHLHYPMMVLSSSDIRERVREGMSIRYMVPPGVETYICDHQLYKAAGKDEPPSYCTDQTAGKDEPPAHCADRTAGYDTQKYRIQLESMLSGARMEHTLGVEYTAAALAMRYGADLGQASLAGLLHDCAKPLSAEEKLSLAERSGIPVSSAERQNPELLHAKLGVELAKARFGVEDDAVLQAIRWHTTGRPAMTLLDKIVYIADYIEPSRTKADRLPQLRALAFRDLDECLFLILEQTVQYLESTDQVIDPITGETYEYYRDRRMKD